MSPPLLRFIFHAVGVAGFALLGLTACATSSEIKALVADPTYPTGYHDGCKTAVEAGKSFSAHATHDKDLFETKENYRAGWRQGFIACKRDVYVPAENIGDLGERAEHF